MTVALTVMGVMLGLVFGTGGPLTPASAPIVSAQETVANVCADDAAHSDRNDYVATVRFAAGDPFENVKAVYEYNVAEGYHLRFYNLGESATTPVGERIVIWRGADSPARSADTSRSAYVTATSYGRGKDQDSNQWGAWTVGEKEHYMGGQGSAQPSFCGWILNDATTVQYLGRELINGVNMRKYSINVERDDNPNVRGQLDERWKLWIDDNGRTVKTALDVGTGNRNTVAETTFSNYGERNVITAPGATPAPGVTPEVTPEVKVTPEVTEEPTQEPTPEPTPTPTPTPVLSLPSAPSGLTAQASFRGITLNWQAPDDDSVTGYHILRRRPQAGENTFRALVKNTGSTATTFIDTDVRVGIRHVYRVKAVNADGVSRSSNTAHVTPYGR